MRRARIWPDLQRRTRPHDQHGRGELRSGGSGQLVRHALRHAGALSYPPCGWRDFGGRLSFRLLSPQFLVELQASGEAWAMALSLLERPEPELQFYGSHMLYQKARSGRGNLTRENKVELAT
eukprot:scaffold7768_cov277-Pinguiococcus_pyrenoidosus.AAC.6